MRHSRSDYDTIQPWPTKRPHIVRIYDVDDSEGEVVDTTGWPDGFPHGDEAEAIIPDDEPVFLIRAKDAVGSDAVRAWAHAAERVGADPKLCESVLAWADEMDDYRYVNYDGGKVPDVPIERLRDAPGAESAPLHLTALAEDSKGRGKFVVVSLGLMALAVIGIGVSFGFAWACLIIPFVFLAGWVAGEW